MDGVTVGIYRVSGVVTLGVKAFPNQTAAGWQQVAFDTPIALTAGIEYATVIYTPSRYVATVSYAWPVVSGDLTAGADNGWFTSGVASNQLPTTESPNNASYFADLVFQPTGSGPTSVSSDLDLRWQVRNEVSSDLDLRWRILGEEAAPTAGRGGWWGLASILEDARAYQREDKTLSCPNDGEPLIENHCRFCGLEV